MSTPASSSAALPIAHVVLRILIVVNWLMGAAILALLVVMPNEQWIMAAFKLSPSPDAERLIMGLRAVAVLGLVGIPLNYAVLKRLLAIVLTVRAGDPFIAANARHLQAIGWALLAIQILSLIIGAIAPSRCRIFNQRLARRDSHLPAGARVRGRHDHARRPRRNGVTWRSASS